MCRMAAYLGPEAPLSTLLLDPPHSLERQAYQPREMLSGTVNVDGTGIAWWTDEGEEPLAYASDKPPWSDLNVTRLAPRLHSGCQLAAVRSATPGLASGAGAAAPFVAEGIAFAHNGYVERFREVLVAPLLEGLEARALGTIDVLTDSSALFARLVDLRLREPSRPLEELVEIMLRRVDEICVTFGVRAQMNLIVAARGRVVALRHAQGLAPNSLYVLEDGARWPGARIVASEPLDEDSSWTPLPPGTVTVLDETGLATRPLLSKEGAP